MRSTRPGSSARRSRSSRAAPRSIATWASWPQACIAPWISEAKSRPGVLGQRQGIHVGAEEDRRAGLGAVDQRRHGAEPTAEDRLETESPELLDDDRLGDRQIRPDLRVTMDPAADRDDVGQERASVREEGGVVGRGFGRHQDASMRHDRSAALFQPR